MQSYEQEVQIKSHIYTTIVFWDGLDHKDDDQFCWRSTHILPASIIVEMAAGGKITLRYIEMNFFIITRQKCRNYVGSRKKTEKQTLMECSCWASKQIGLLFSNFIHSIFGRRSSRAVGWFYQNRSLKVNMAMWSCYITASFIFSHTFSFVTQIKFKFCYTLHSNVYTYSI